MTDNCPNCGLLLDADGHCYECECDTGPEYDDGTGLDLGKCPYCRGSGYVTVTSAPEYQFVTGGAEVCQACDGEGRI